MSVTDNHGVFGSFDHAGVEGFDSRCVRSVSGLTEHPPVIPLSFPARFVTVPAVSFPDVSPCAESRRLLSPTASTAADALPLSPKHPTMNTRRRRWGTPKN